MDAPDQPRPRWLRGAVAAFVAFQLAAGALLVTNDPRPRPATAPRGAASPIPTATRAPDRAALRTTAVERLLDRRARAIRTRDRALFESTLDPLRPEFARRQRAVFAALKDVPVGTWRYDLDPGDATTPAGYAGEAWAPRVTLRYSLRGWDKAPAAADQYLTFVRRGAEWRIAGDRDRRDGARMLWDFGPVRVVRGAHSLVLGHPGNDALLRDVARHADDAVPRVTKVWGTGWSRRVVVVVPATQREAGEILDETDLDRIAAVAVAELPDGALNPPVGNRIVVNPPNIRRLGPVGRRVVMTHEVTHVATRDAGAIGVPTWVVEGFADYVGYLGTGLPTSLICHELAADVRAGKPPKRLPSETDFSGANSRLSQAYEGAWLAVRLIAERIGEKGLVRVYRRVAGREPLPKVLHDELGRTAPEFVKDWRRYVVRTLS